jgi:hypothetical protein
MIRLSYNHEMQHFIARLLKKIIDGKILDILNNTIQLITYIYLSWETIPFFLKQRFKCY